jgi:hypothetical protein
MRCYVLCYDERAIEVATSAQGGAARGDKSWRIDG